jgi:hypothetical protein
MPFAYKSINTERNAAETRGLDRCFLRGFVLRFRAAKLTALVLNLLNLR